MGAGPQGPARFSRSDDVSLTITLLELGSLVLLIGAGLGLGRMFLRPAAQRADRKMAMSPSAENASRLLVLILGLSVIMAVFAVIWRFAP
jgi:hypothetical protein